MIIKHIIKVGNDLDLNLMLKNTLANQLNYNPITGLSFFLCFFLFFSRKDNISLQS